MPPTPDFGIPICVVFSRFFVMFFRCSFFRSFVLDGFELGPLGSKKATKMEEKVVPERGHFKENGAPQKRLDFYCNFNEI